MNTYAPLFKGLVESSIWLEPDTVRIVWITMLALKDRDHVVRHNAFQIGRFAVKSEQEVIEALKVLSSPDTRRIEPQPFEGRRIERVESGWLILNGEKYFQQAKLTYKIISNRDAVARHRANHPEKKNKK